MERKIILQIKDDGEKYWSTLSTEMSEDGKGKKLLQAKQRGWMATHFPNAQFRIVPLSKAKEL